MKVIKIILSLISFMTVSLPAFAATDVKIEMAFYNAVSNAVVDQNRSNQHETVRAIINQGITDTGEMFFNIQYLDNQHRCNQDVAKVSSKISSTGEILNLKVTFVNTSRQACTSR